MTIDLPWFQETWAHLVDRAEKDTLPHALLITAPKGIGKLEFTRAFAKYLLGKTTHENHWLENSVHPDYYELSPIDDKKNISIDQVRTLIQRLSQTGHQNGYKIVIIYPAETMNIASSNALLKTLEAPQGKTLLMLCSHQSSRLLPTITSRCQRVKLRMPTHEEAKGWLTKKCDDHTHIDTALSITENRPLAALEMIQNDKINFYQESFQSLNDLTENKINPIKLAETWAKNDIEDYINLMQLFVSQIIKDSISPLSDSPLPLCERHSNSPLPLCERHSNSPLPLWERSTPDIIRGRERGNKNFSLLDKITKAKRHLQTQSNPNKQLLLENLLLEFIWN